MEARQLEIFLAVIETSSVTRAAEKVDLSPGAVSLQLHNLAAELQTELFSRSGKHLVPTPAARHLAEHARGVLRQMRQIKQEYLNDPATDTRPFHFATGATALIHYLGRPLRLLRRQFPRTAIHVTVSATEESVAGLLDRRFDLALISLPFPRESDLSLIPLFEEELLLLRPSKNPVRRWHAATISPAILESEPFLLYPKRSNMRTMIDGLFAELGVQPRVTMEADDTEALKRLVESGFGCSFLPDSALRNQSRYFHTCRISGHRLVRRQALAMARSEYPRALTQSIAHFLSAALAKENPSASA
jgi:DNA-binding transcriptional LysR family regulator